MKMLENFKLRNLSIKNRIVMAPMCVDSSDNTGKTNDFHYIHYITRAIGGVGLIIVEATAVLSNGRIKERDLGLWEDDQIYGLRSIVEGCHSYDSRIALQLAHSGRKCEISFDTPVAPSSISFSGNFKMPRELNKADIELLVDSFRAAAGRAEKAGFDAIEIHAAHGYLIHEFLSPLTNHRIDEYGGSMENRTRFLKEILKEIRKVWPDGKPIILRVSASDYMAGGIDVHEMVRIIDAVKPFIDAVHVSSGGLIIVPINVYPGYQVKFCEIIRQRCNIPAIAVGLITECEQVEEILKNNRADMVSLGRELLRNPYWMINKACVNGNELNVPFQYGSAFRANFKGQS